MENTVKSSLLTNPLAGFRVQGLRFRVQGLGFRVQGLTRDTNSDLPDLAAPSLIQGRSLIIETKVLRKRYR